MPESDCMCEGSSDPCCGIRSIDRKQEVRGRTISIVGVVSANEACICSCTLKEAVLIATLI